MIYTGFGWGMLLTVKHLIGDGNTARIAMRMKMKHLQILYYFIVYCMELETTGGIVESHSRLRCVRRNMTTNAKQ